MALNSENVEIQKHITLLYYLQVLGRSKAPIHKATELYCKILGGTLVSAVLC